MEQRLLVVGGGRMGTALVKGLGSAGWALTDITVAEVDSTRRDALARELPGVTVVAEPVPAAGAVVAVKPAAAAAACAVLAESAVPRWLSIMAGVTIDRLEAWAGPAVAVVRAMPNTPALVGAGISAVAAGSNAGEADLAWAEEVLGSVGAVVRVDEAALDAVTGVSGSGPAYVFLVAEALAQAGEAAGLEAGISRRLAVATVAGAGRLLAEPGSEPEDLRAQVTSPGGTTQAALAVLEEGELRDLFARAVAAAAERSRELGREGT
ncbi:MAG TPA: pyrroline-5-carboxylate reductase [Acidimicrobiales bacterium]|nr:pyrroline-5-carboxylate reductase [Acidimicrobiales bacterium]